MSVQHHVMLEFAVINFVFGAFSFKTGVGNEDITVSGDFSENPLD